MNPNLFETLVSRNIINDNTEIEARIRKNDLSGVSYMKFTDTFYYVGHYVEDNHGTVIVSDSTEGAGATIRMDDILTIDGMAPDRLASIYALNAEGESLRQGARRGRKPKNRAAA